LHAVLITYLQAFLLLVLQCKTSQNTHYCAGDKIEKNEMGGACSADGEGRGVYRVLVGNSEGKRPLRRPGLRWEDNIKTDLQEEGCESMDWIELAQDRDVAGTCECDNERSGCIKFLD
jgi:hypothetical protein